MRRRDMGRRLNGSLYWFGRSRCIETRSRIDSSELTTWYVWLNLCTRTNLCQFVLLTTITRSYWSRRSDRFRLNDFGSSNRDVIRFLCPKTRELILSVRENLGEEKKSGGTYDGLRCLILLSGFVVDRVTRSRGIGNSFSDVRWDHISFWSCLNRHVRSVEFENLSPTSVHTRYSV